MRSCPRCEASIDDDARYCVECGAPQTEDAAAELDEYVQRQARQVADERDDESASDGLADAADLTDRGQLWRRGCYVVGYGTVVVALTLVPQIGALPLLVAGVVILPPVRRLTAEPLGSPLKREVMAGIYGVFVLVGIALFALL